MDETDVKSVWQEVYDLEYDEAVHRLRRALDAPGYRPADGLAAHLEAIELRLERALGAPIERLTGPELRFVRWMAGCDQSTIAAFLTLCRRLSVASSPGDVDDVDDVDARWWATGRAFDLIDTMHELDEELRTRWERPVSAVEQAARYGSVEYYLDCLDEHLAVARARHAQPNGDDEFRAQMTLEALAKLQRLSGWAMRSALEDARSAGGSWDFLACAAQAPVGMLQSQYATGGRIVVSDPGVCTERTVERFLDDDAPLWSDTDGGRGESSAGPANPWATTAPACPACASTEEVYLWAPDGPLRWICSPCGRRFDPAS